MSDLQRSFAKVKLAGLPTEPPLPPNVTIEENQFAEEDTDELQALLEPEQDEDSSSASSASSASSTGTIRPNSKHLFARPTGFVYLLYLLSQQEITKVLTRTSIQEAKTDLSLFIAMTCLV